VKLTKMPCIPDAICVPSFKFSSKCEGTMYIGTSGIGYVSFCPWTMVVNNPLVTNAAINPPIITTTADYSHLEYQALSVDVPIQIQVGVANSPFTTDTFLSGFPTLPEFRLVGAGVEIEYTGKLLDQSGTITVLQNNGLNDFPDGTTPTQLMNNPRSKTCSNSKDNRCYISYQATGADYLSYQNLGYYYPGVLELGHNHPLLIMVSGATPGISFRYKAVAYFECQLNNTDATPSESDPIGYPAFQSARTELLPSDSPEEDLKTVLKGTITNIARSVSGMGGDIGGALGVLVGQPILGRTAGNAAGALLSSLLGN